LNIRRIAAGTLPLAPRMYLIHAALAMRVFMKSKRKKATAAAQKAALWEKVILEARASSLGIQEYLRLKKISKNTYYYWFKRLRVDHPEWEDVQKSARQTSEEVAEERPETEVVEKATRRKFTAEYKRKILEEADAAPEGHIASLLRREGLYASHLAQWRRERAADALEAKQRGPIANPLTKEVRQLREENARLQQKLKQATDIIEVQKKISEILGLTPEPMTEES
jgi:transposase